MSTESSVDNECQCKCQYQYKELSKELEVLKIKIKSFEDSINKIESKAASDKEQALYQMTKEARYAREMGKKKP